MCQPACQHCRSVWSLATGRGEPELRTRGHHCNQHRLPTLQHQLAPTQQLADKPSTGHCARIHTSRPTTTRAVLLWRIDDSNPFTDRTEWNQLFNSQPILRLLGHEHRLPKTPHFPFFKTIRQEFSGPQQISASSNQERYSEELNGDDQ